MKISACIIAKNEEENLPRLLNSLKGKFDEIVLVDTGSTDKTIEIAKSYGCRVFEKEWNGFADARNYAVEKATGDWIWFFDADMELEEKEYERFKRILSIVKNDNINGIRVIYRNISPDGKVISLSSTVHIHKKLPYLKWVGKIHERLINEKGDVIVPPYPVYVNHYGYSDPDVMKKKIKRNLGLLEEELIYLDIDKNPEEYLIKLFYLAQSYAASLGFYPENLDKTIHYSEKFLNINKEKKVIPQTNIFNKHIYIYLLNGYLNKKDFAKAEKALDEALSIDSKYPDYLYIKGILEKEKGNIKKAVEAFLDFIVVVDRTTSSKNPDLNIISDYSHNIKDLVEEGLLEYPVELDKIKNLWKKEKGIYSGVLLSNIYLKNNNKKEAVKVLNKLYKLYKDPFVGNKLAKIYEEDNPEKAEMLYKDIIKYAPQYAETFYNLALLLSRHKRIEESLSFATEYVKRTKSQKGLLLLYDLLKDSRYKDEAKKLEKIFTL